MPGAVVVGTGFGARVHVPALRGAGFDVVALVGRDEEKTARRAARLDVPNACSSLEVALRFAGTDVVTIATPPDTHAGLAIEATGAGRHVLCEKPFALDAEEARAMLDAATHAGVVALIGHEFRWAEDRVTLARAVADGIIGTPRQFSFVMFVPMAADPDTPMPPWWFDRARGGGWLGASGSHVVDQVRTTLGEFEAVSAALPTVAARPADAAEDSFVVRASLEAGVEGVVQQTAAAWTPEALGVSVIAGTDGTLETSGSQVFVSDRAGRRELPVPDDARLPPHDVSDDPRHRYTHLELGPYTRLCQALRALADGGEPSSAVPVPTFADGLAGSLVLDAIRASAAAGGALVPLAPGERA